MRNTKNYILLFILILISTTISAQNPANPNANEKTKEVLQYLSNLKNKSNNKLLLGQDLGHGSSMLSGYNNYVSELRNQTGKWIGMIGGDYGLDGNHNVYQTNQLLIDYWNDGGLVTLSWHFDNPWTGGDSWDTNNYENLWELTDPNSGMYNVWRAQLAEVANALRPLRDAGVTVLWRPLHEMNGDWFWWGEKYWSGHEEAYKNLYINMFNYLTYEQGMNNLLWVYSVGNTYNQTLKNYYPGSQYVDVVGMDLYDDNANTYNPSREYQDMKSLGHPMGFTEFGPTISSAYGNYDYRRMVNNIKSKYPDFVFSYAWHNWPGANIAYASNQYTWNTFNDSWVITRDEIDLEGGNPPPPPPSSGFVGELRIKNLWTNTYLHQTANSPGAKVRLFPLNQNWYSQRWNIENADAGTYRLKCSWGGNYLNNTADYNQAPVNVYSYNGGWWSQMWHIENAGDGRFRFKNRWTGRYLQTPDQLEIETHDLNTNWWSQIWVLEYLDGRNVRLAQGETVELQISPNPATSFIQLKGIDTPLDYQIYDTSGKIVLQGEGQTMNVSTLAKGTYLLVGYLKNEDGTDRFARGIFIKK